MRVRQTGPRAPDSGCHPSPRLPCDPGRGAAVQLRVRPHQSGGRPDLHLDRSEDPLLTTQTAHIAVPHGIAVADPAPDVLPPAKVRRGLWGAIYRHPTVAIGSVLLVIMLLVAVLAPYLATVDPTALAPAKRTRAPSAEFWFGTDMMGRDIYSRVLYGARISLIVGFSVALLASLAG